ncbi:hypothetical protein FRX31_002801 [Thalictrum thalictroides]|uniref:Uncharacterized protein n=1 Tax=Thalictrum thalictroides TaxID=46969 RepID=A0A7J6XCU1_THATH|nr:hypothetical protein FRX31_002801 [Thalictrum thalictroides]
MFPGLGSYKYLCIRYPLWWLFTCAGEAISGRSFHGIDFLNFLIYPKHMISFGLYRIGPEYFGFLILVPPLRALLFSGIFTFWASAGIYIWGASRPQKKEI